MPTRPVNVICSSCDIGCPLVAEVEDGRIRRIRTHDHPALRDYICMKGAAAPLSFRDPGRLTHPLRRVGPRGSGEFERVGWDEAMTEIAGRLSTVIAEHGPEAWAVASSQWNTSVDNGLGRRLMNLVGSPNWISGVALCAGNTAAVNRLTYGWFPQPDYSRTDCIVLFGHNPRKHSWTPVFQKIRKAQQRGAALIVLDPRRSESAERADLWLPLRAGTDAAMGLGWVRTILDEDLQQHDFVRDWTIGIDELRERVQEWPLDRVADITGVDAELIATAARTYASRRPGVIPWTPVTDQQINSTSAIRLHAILRALTGNLDVRGGEVLQGLHPDVIAEDDLELHGELDARQKDKQLGAADHPVFTYRGTAALEDATERVWGHRHVNLITGSYMAVPAAVFRAMADDDPYPVRAFFSLGNNTLLGYSSMDRLLRAVRRQDLVVVHEHRLTPTAQLADFVLPGDSWLERPQLFDAYGWVAGVSVSRKAIDPPGECRSVFAFWTDLAERLGHGDRFPWRTLEELYDHRLEPLGTNWARFSEEYMTHAPPPEERKYLRTGFATPSGKVELSSSVLAGFGFDPLPYYREAPGPDAAFPLTMFMGVRDDEFFQTNHRHVGPLRRRRPEPQFFLAPRTARDLGLADGDDAVLSTATGRVHALVAVRDAMPPGLVRVPHGWWLPEGEPGLAGGLSGALTLSDSLVTSDEPEYLDPEQGVPHLKGIPCRVEPAPYGTVPRWVPPRRDR